MNKKAKETFIITIIVTVIFSIIIQLCISIWVQYLRDKNEISRYWEIYFLWYCEAIKLSNQALEDTEYSLSHEKCEYFLNK